MQRNAASPTFDEVSTLIETAVNYINNRYVSLGPDTFHMAPISVTAEPEIAAVSVQPSVTSQQQQQFRPQRQGLQQVYHNGVDYDRNSNNQYQPRPSIFDQNRSNRPQGQNQGQGTPAIPADIIQGNCFKCNNPGHWARV